MQPRIGFAINSVEISQGAGHAYNVLYSVSGVTYEVSHHETSGLTVVMGATPYPASVIGVEEKIEELRDVLQRLGVPVANLEVGHSPRLGTYVLVVIDADAKQALEL